MLNVSRKFAFVLLTALALAATGCGGNASKIVGKWKVTGAGDEQVKASEGVLPYMEVKSDGTGTFGVEVTDPKAKEFFGDGFSFNFKYKVSGDKIELTDLPKEGKKEGPFGKSDNPKGTLKFDDNDTLTITPEDPKDKPMKLSRT